MGYIENICSRLEKIKGGWLKTGSWHRTSSRLQNSRFFFSKSVKKTVKRGVRVLCARSAQASHAPRVCEAREKKNVFLASLPSLALCCQPRSQLFVWSLARGYLNTQKYGLFCRSKLPVDIWILSWNKNSLKRLAIVLVNYFKKYIIWSSLQIWCMTFVCLLWQLIVNII